MPRVSEYSVAVLTISSNSPRLAGARSSLPGRRRNGGVAPVPKAFFTGILRHFPGYRFQAGLQIIRLDGNEQGIFTLGVDGIGLKEKRHQDRACRYIHTDFSQYSLGVLVNPLIYPLLSRQGFHITNSFHGNISLRAVWMQHNDLLIAMLRTLKFILFFRRNRTVKQLDELFISLSHSCIFP